MDRNRRITQRAADSQPKASSPSGCSRPQAAFQSSGSRVRVFDVRELLGDSNEVRVRHCDEEYRLMLTRNNKLILTK